MVFEAPRRPVVVARELPFEALLLFVAARADFEPAERDREADTPEELFVEPVFDEDLFFPEELFAALPVLEDELFATALLERFDVLFAGVLADPRFVLFAELRFVLLAEPRLALFAELRFVLFAELRFVLFTDPRFFAEPRFDDELEDVLRVALPPDFFALDRFDPDVRDVDVRLLAFFAPDLVALALDALFFDPVRAAPADFPLLVADPFAPDALFFTPPEDDPLFLEAVAVFVFPLEEPAERFAPPALRFAPLADFLPPRFAALFARAVSSLTNFENRLCSPSAVSS